MANWYYLRFPLAPENKLWSKSFEGWISGWAGSADRERKFGEIGIDGGFPERVLGDPDPWDELRCNTFLVGDFGTFFWKRLLPNMTMIPIEPSELQVFWRYQGCQPQGALVRRLTIKLNSHTTGESCWDAKMQMYMKNFGEFLIPDSVCRCYHHEPYRYCKWEKGSGVLELSPQPEIGMLLSLQPDRENLDGKEVGRSKLWEHPVSPSLQEMLEEEHEHHHHHDGECGCGCHDHEEYELITINTTESVASHDHGSYTVHLLPWWSRAVKGDKWSIWVSLSLWQKK